MDSGLPQAAKPIALAFIGQSGVIAIVDEPLLSVDESQNR